MLEECETAASATLQQTLENVSLGETRHADGNELRLRELEDELHACKTKMKSMEDELLHLRASSKLEEPRGAAASSPSTAPKGTSVTINSGNSKGKVAEARNSNARNDDGGHGKEEKEKSHDLEKRVEELEQQLATAHSKLKSLQAVNMQSEDEANVASVSNSDELQKMVEGIKNSRARLPRHSASSEILIRQNFKLESCLDLAMAELGASRKAYARARKDVKRLEKRLAKANEDKLAWEQDMNRYVLDRSILIDRLSEAKNASKMCEALALQVKGLEEKYSEATAKLRQAELTIHKLTLFGDRHDAARRFMIHFWPG